jgi:hypothetical protein
MAAVLAAMVIPPHVSGEIVDRVVAVVGQSVLGVPGAAGQIITWSAAYEEARYQAFQAGEEPPEWTSAAESNPQLREVIEQMVDQLLLEQALNRSPIALSGDEDVSGRMQELMSRYPGPQTIERELARYGLSERSLANRLRREEQLMEFVEFTLRPDVRVTEEQVEDYYRSILLPQLERGTETGGTTAGAPSLNEVRGQIEEVLTQREIDRALEQWLQQLRRNARISLRLE